MKEIPLTQGKVALVDDEDFTWLNQWKWHLHGDGYAVRCEGESNKNVYMHREILKPPIGMMADHRKSTETLNNQRSNLRICTHQENNLNRCVEKRNSSGYKGVHKCADGKFWRVRIRINGKQIILGYFTIPEEAAHVYDKKAVELFGEFAWLNFPEEWINRDKEYDQ